MSRSEIDLDQLARAIATSLSRERMTYFLPLIRLLATGEPVSQAHLATALGRPEEEVTAAVRQFADIVYAADGRIVGAGLSLLPTPYRFAVQGQVLYTWCALDTLLFPLWLECSAQVSSCCPVTGTPIHLRVSPESIEQLTPATGVISLLLQEGLATCVSIRDTFCAYSQFFAERQAASTWSASHPAGSVLSIEEAFPLAQQVARLTMQRLQEGKQ